MVLDDHTMSETLCVLTDLSSVPQMWHVWAGTQRWSKLKAYFSLLLKYPKIQRAEMHLGSLPTSSPAPLLSAQTHFSPFSVSSQTTSSDGVLSRSEGEWETCLCCQPPAVITIWVSDYWTCSRSSSIGTCTRVVKRPAGTGELLMVRLMNQSDSSLLCRGRKQVTQEVSDRTVCSLWW